MAMIDLKRDKPKKDPNKAIGGSPMPLEEDTYHHGLGVQLGPEEVKKLKLHPLPRVGEKLHIRAHAHVKSVRQEIRDGKPQHHVELELRKMEIAGNHKPDESELNKGAKKVMDRALAGKDGMDSASESDEDARDTSKGGEDGEEA